MTLDQMDQLVRMGFNKEHGENFSYYVYKHKGFVFHTSTTDEPLKVFFGDEGRYWTDLENVKNTIYFLHNTEID